MLIYMNFVNELICNNESDSMRQNRLGWTESQKWIKLANTTYEREDAERVFEWNSIPEAPARPRSYRI